MRNDILRTIDNKNDYLTVLEAITGGKETFTAAETAQLLAIYEKGTENRFGFADKALAKPLLILDTAQDKLAPETSPLSGALEKADLDALSALAALCGDLECKPALAVAAKSAALAEGVNGGIALALARAALDALAGQPNIASYRGDIEALADRLTQAEDAEFADASAFLIRVRERTM